MQICRAPPEGVDGIVYDDTVEISRGFLLTAAHFYVIFYGFSPSQNCKHQQTCNLHWKNQQPRRPVPTGLTFQASRT